MMRLALLATPLALALGLVLGAPDELGRLAGRRAAGLLVEAARHATWTLPLLVVAAAAHLRQGRLVLAGLISAFVAAAIVGPLSIAHDPALQLASLGGALGIPLVAILGERSLRSGASLARLATAGTIVGAGAVALAMRPAIVSDLIARLGPAGLPLGPTPVPALGAVGFVALAVVAWRARRRDAEVLRPMALFVPLAQLAAATAAGGHEPRLIVPLAPEVLLLAAALTLGLALLLLAARHGTVDALTGLPGRRALDDALDGLRGRYSVAVVDVDRFKRFNDRHGHAAGDVVLRAVADGLARVPGGRAHRQGGEEFVLLFPGLDLDDAVERTDAARQALAARVLPGAGTNGAELRVTFSAGVATRSDRSPRPRAVLEAADQALRRAKKRGRNRVEAERRQVSDRERRKRRR